MELEQMQDAKSATYYFKEKLEFASVNSEHIEFIKNVALKTRDSARICLHRDGDSDLHNMLIVHPKGKYIRPHKNPKKSKAYQIVEGAMRMIGIDDVGKKLFDRELSNEGDRMVRIEKNVYLLLLPLTQLVVFHEIALGPFVRGGGGFSSLCALCSARRV
ncbi:WbuC family cupin fold metalloprotein [Helicobacter sp.]|uniref:WbuC family cupin fold metalloprotein n=1 Tax=Helicobacter sp. TaxID=218 RepID=UPI0025BCE1A4|nr:WbuC family cupin fold metalloprotein [Helicobacter sp.]MCI5968200.1 WbuC family cupin fold metalloprotein [Helicobacter sp.]